MMFADIIKYSQENILFCQKHIQALFISSLYYMYFFFYPIVTLFWTLTKSNFRFYILVLSGNFSE